ncbi:hypothetical protein [Dyella mobilis]|uniref:hypothetical protein n=1 Tax=Dyella mobilis TaxID=1849582 RepID=UPI001EF9B0EB|nr:hypothetical protein [Dyella mobilis]GLQ96423.1 hypothetical protein GCM10007863_08410 [Dyella mobilis]
MGAAEKIDISGKDWLTEPEAAYYCGVSLRKFQTDYLALGVRPRRFMGKKLYSKSELFELIEKSQQWQSQPSNGADTSPISHGPKAASAGGVLPGRFQAVPLRKFVPRKKRNSSTE